MDINLSSQIVVQTAAQWAVDATVYSNKRILVTSDEYYGSTDQRKFKIADGTQTWSQLDYMTLVQNGATNGYIPKSNGTDLVNSILQEYASGLKITNDKFLANTTTDAAVYWDVDYISLIGIGGTFNGYESIYISPSEFGLKSSINNFLVSEVARMILKHDTKVEIDTPTILLTQGTASKFLKTDASKNITYVDSPVDVNTIGSAINGALSATPNDTDLVMSVDSSVAKKNTWTQIKAFLKSYFDTVYKATFTENTAFNKNFGTGTTNIVEIGSTLGNSLITSTDANGKLQTLTTATYPSLTELSYVKGLTSAVQTQLNSKGYTLIGGTSATNPADSTTYFFGGVQSQGLLSSENVTTKMPIPKTGTIKSVQLSFINSGATTESSTMLLRLNATTDYTISTTTDMSSSLVANYALSIPVTQGDTFCFKWTTPAWVTNPANLRFHIVVYIE